MKNRKYSMGRRGLLFLLVMALGVTAGVGLLQQNHQPETGVTQALAESTVDEWEIELMDFSHEPDNVIYLAGGCFWGMQKYLQTIPGVEKTVVGYANGEWNKEVPPNYLDVTSGLTGFRETVYVEYDPEEVSLENYLHFRRRCLEFAK